MQRTSFKTLAALTGALGTGMAMAVSNGITNPAPGQVINPYTGQEIQAWKLVGALGASAVQIHRNWLVMAGHEGNATGMSFSNAQSNGTSYTATVLKGTTVCATVTPLNDIGITGTATSNVCATTN